MYYKQDIRLDLDQDLAQENIKQPKNQEPLFKDLEQIQIMEQITQEVDPEMVAQEEQEPEKNQNIKI